MPGFLREHSWSLVASALLHALLAAALVLMAWNSLRDRPVTLQPLPIDAQVIDSQVLRAAQKELADQTAQETARVRAAAEAKAAAQAAQEKQREDAKRAVEEAARADAEEKAAQSATAAAADKALLAENIAAAERSAAQRAASAEKAAAAVKRAAEQRKAEDAHRAEDAQRALEAKRAEEAKRADDAKRAADAKLKADREAELRRQLADEEHANAVATGPLRSQYEAMLRNRIEHAWIRPPSARAGLDCLVQVTQVPGGEVTGVQVTQCNGDAASRESIENAVYRASPLPTPPDPALFARTFAFHFHPDQ